jgi:hypothetical protein
MLESLDLSRTLRRLPVPARASARAVRARAAALELIERDLVAAPAYCFRILPVLGIRGAAIDVGEAVLEAPALTDQTGELVAVAAVASTLGEAIQARVSALFEQRRPSLALAVDTLAGELLFRVADRAVAAIRREAHRMGLEIGVEASPGDTGVALDQQAAVLALAQGVQAGGQAGIAIARGGMLSPVHSACTLVALGRHLPRHSASARCIRCPSADRCAIRPN